MKITKSAKIVIIAFLILPVIHLLVFSYIPILANLYLSFTNYKGIGTPKWIGIKNYKKLLTDTRYISLFKNCLWYMLMAIPQLTFAFILAVVVNGKFKGLNFFKGV